MLTLDGVDLHHLADAPLQKQVVQLRALFGFTQDELASLLGVSPRTLQRWEQGGQVEPHPRNKQAVCALRLIAETLGDVFEPDTIKVWVDRPNPALNGERPRDYARKQGGLYIMAQLLGAVGH